MTDVLEAELDTLFQLRPAEMVEARNALADRLKKAGDREASARIKCLKRPSPVAWAINAVFFHERTLLERAQATVADLRALQATDGVDRQQLTAAGDAQRAALQAIVDAAVRLSAAAGLSTGPLQERKVFTTVQGWLAGGGDEPPGRMTHELEPGGFETIGLLGTPAPLPLPPAAVVAPLGGVAAALPEKRHPTLRAAAPVAVPDRAETLRRERERAVARVAEHKQYVEWAEERVTAQRGKRAVAEHDVERTKREVADAEKTLRDKRALLVEREAALARKDAELGDAERAQREAAAALAVARAELAKLERS